MFDLPTDELKDQLRAVLEAGISDEAMKPIKKAIDDISYQIETDIFYRAKDELANNLTDYVAEMAKKTVEQLLAGNDDQMRRYLGCEKYGYSGRDPRYAEVIHSTMFEPDCLKLRRQIVEVHRDLIASERILDLEMQVKGLVDQVIKIKAEKEALYERLR